MQGIEILGNIKVEFAHVYKAERYENTITLKENEIEVCFLTQGELWITDGTHAYTAQTGDITCVRGCELRVKSESFHCHHTVRFILDGVTGAEKGLLLPRIIKASSQTQGIESKIDSFIYQPYLYADSPTKTNAAALEILCKIDELFRQEKGQNFKEGQMLSLRAKKYVHKNLANPITQTEAARYLGVSPGYFCAQFKKAEGCTFMSYVNRTKLGGVKSLMEKEGLKLKDAALRFGYADPNYVSHLYKKTFGRNVTSRSETPKLTGEE